MPTEPQPITLAAIVQRAQEVVDPDGADNDVTDFVLRFEDADQPVTALAEAGRRLTEAAGAVDPQQESGPLQIAAAVATYLAFRRDELNAEPDELVRLAVRAEFEGQPPAPVAAWLSTNRVKI